MTTRIERGGAEGWAKMCIPPFYLAWSSDPNTIRGQGEERGSNLFSLIIN